MTRHNDESDTLPPEVIDGFDALAQCVGQAVQPWVWLVSDVWPWEPPFAPFAFTFAWEPIVCSAAHRHRRTATTTPPWDRYTRRRDFSPPAQVQLEWY